MLAEAVFDGRLALVNWCAEHATTYGSLRAGPEAWAAIPFGGGAMVEPSGRVRGLSTN